jgi:hypothetical protein
MRLYDKIISSMSKVTNALNELKSILTETPEEKDVLTKEEEQNLQTEMIKLIIATKQFNVRK